MCPFILEGESKFIMKLYQDKCFEHNRNVRVTGFKILKISKSAEQELDVQADVRNNLKIF